MIQGPLPLILLAARDHPEASFRDHLWNELEDWLASKGQTLDEEKVENIFGSQKGTFLEPFRMMGEDRKIANFLVRLALSADIGISRFRVVSQDTIGNSGGVVCTRQGKSYYSEQYALGKNRLKNSSIQYFAPTMKVSPPTRNAEGRLPPAFMNASEDGIFVEVQHEAIERLDWIPVPDEAEFRSLARDLTAESEIGDQGVLLSDLGLSIRVNVEGIVIGSGSPESLIRLSAYIVQGSNIILKGAGNYEMAIQMPKGGIGEANCIVVAKDEFASEWMDVAGFGAPELEQSDIINISDWALPHAHWTNKIFQESA